MREDATVSVVVLVKDGARHLQEVLAAIARQRIDAQVETLVIDSGSRDDSVAIAGSFNTRLIEIPAKEFGHGKTRNYAAGLASGDRIVFLTQDATPATDDWLASLVAPLDAGERVGLSFGPHLPRAETFPMIARELEEFFGSFSPDGRIRIDAAVKVADPASGFFSNVNSCLLRECWEQVRFRDVAYAEDQGFARDAFAAGWKKAYAPDAKVLHAHDYRFVEFMRRYFDEYRGLRATIGHVAPASPTTIASSTRAQVRDDLAYMRREGYGRSKRLAWGLRSARHHGGRGLSAALGSRSDRLPTAKKRSNSRLVRASGDKFGYVRSHYDRGAAPLAPPSPQDAERSSLHLAWLIPPFRRGSGGHMTIFNIIRELEQTGHSCSIWVHDPGDTMGRPAAALHNEIVEHFSDLRAGVYLGFDDWHGADVAFATGWQTAYPLAQLAACKLKTYLVQDYEPDFYAASAERAWAEETYRMGYPCITASPWLTEVLQTRFGATAGHFELGVDHGTYRPLGLEREPRTILFYARPATPRRATELGMLALAEVAARAGDVRLVLFGDVKPVTSSFDYEFAGVLDERELALLYNEATVGLVLSLTNYSRIPKEMMACGLPVVDLRHPSVESVFGASGDLIEMADPTPPAIAEKLLALIGGRQERDHLAAAAREFVAPMTWGAAAAQIEAHARRWLGERWSGALDGGGHSRSASVDFVRR